MLRPEDKSLLEQKGISEEQLDQQLQRFATGFPYLKILQAARPEFGITVLSPEQRNDAVVRWKKYLADGGEVSKFVPASGAASRMFKALFEFVGGADEIAPEGSAVDRLVANIHNFAFAPDLEKVTENIYGKSIDELVAEGRQKELVKAIIEPEGLNYGALPKGLLKFHAYDGIGRTPVEEHLAEGAQTAANADGVVNLHFTVSANHRKIFEEKIAEVLPEVEKRHGVKFNISLSEQKPSTDTVAANPDGTPFLDDDGKMLFRPGGHGALIQNLNDIESAVVFIKNIDNVVPDSRRDSTVEYKQILGGYLIQLHDQISDYLHKLSTGDYTRGTLQEMLNFMHFSFSICDRSIDGKNDTEVAVYIFNKLMRPLRVCGMVRNEGEPGGGPFVAFNADGSASLQILESHQIDKSDPVASRHAASSTHFNPVDLVCYIKDCNGKKFNLPDYVDSATGFISEKSYHGRTLRALELPGLWNGAMSDWLTAFVEVPESTFNPVKTVNDLLRDAHRN